MFDFFLDRRLSFASHRCQWLIQFRGSEQLNPTGGGIVTSGCCFTLLSQLFQHGVNFKSLIWKWGQYFWIRSNFLHMDTEKQAAPGLSKRWNKQFNFTKGSRFAVYGCDKCLNFFGWQIILIWNGFEASFLHYWLRAALNMQLFKIVFCLIGYKDISRQFKGKKKEKNKTHQEIFGIQRSK